MKKRNSILDDDSEFLV